MKPSLYIETSVVSYLTARLSRDLITAARQQLTAVWGARQRARYDLFISPLVLEEAELGDPEAAAARLAILGGLDLVMPSSETDALAEALLREVRENREAYAARFSYDVRAILRRARARAAECEREVTERKPRRVAVPRSG